MQINGGEVQIGSSGASCTTNRCNAERHVRYSGVTLYFCNGTDWTPSSAGGASGTVNIGSQYQIAYYASDGTVVSGDTSITTDSSNDLIIGLGKLGIGTTSPVVSLDLRAETDAIALPVSTTGQEPASPVNGMIRYNSSVGVQDLEAYVNGAWTTLTTGSNVGGSTIDLGTSATVPNPVSQYSNYTGLFSPSASAVGITISSTEMMRVNATGVGIGTATIANKLDINGAASIGYPGIAAPSNGMIVQGNVGIGASSPAYLLDVNGTVRIAGTTTSYDTLFNYSTNHDIYLRAGTTVGTIVIGDQNTGNVVLGSVGDYVIVNGKLGVGTTNPMSELQVNGGEVQIGSSGASCTANNAGAIRYSGGTLYYCNSSVWTASSAGGASGTVNIGSQYQMANYSTTGNAVSGDSSITTDSSNDLIIGSGKLGIGTTSPVVSLDLRAETDAIALPVGTTGQEPASPVNGMIRYNSSVGVQDLEAYVNGAWTTLTTGSNVGTASIYLGTSAATPDPARNGEPTTGLFTPASGDISISSLGSEIARFTGTGLSIGTTYVSTAAPTNGLLVQGNVGIGVSSPTGVLDVQGGTSTSGNGTNITLTAQNGKATGNRNGGNIVLMPGSASGSGTAGGVAIGQAAANAMLDVNGQVLVEATGYLVLNEVGNVAISMNSAGNSGTLQNDQTNQWSLGWRWWWICPRYASTVMEYEWAGRHRHHHTEKHSGCERRDCGRFIIYWCENRTYKRSARTGQCWYRHL